MEIKIQDYSLISNEWIDDMIKEIESFSGIHDDDYGRLDILKKIKQQLTPSEKLSRMSWEDGHYIGTHFVDNKTSELHKEHFLNSEIELL
jgi:hypothetical protein